MRNWKPAFLLQFAKLEVIAVHPFSAHFITWFFGIANHAPYSFDAFDEAGFHGPIPYSLLWYAFYYPLITTGYWAFFITALAIDTFLVFHYCRTPRDWFIYTSQFSFYFLIASPQDFLIWSFIILGRYHWPFLPLAIATKLPLLPPIYNPALWNFI